MPPSGDVFYPIYQEALFRSKLVFIKEAGTHSWIETVLKIVRFYREELAGYLFHADNVKQPETLTIR